VVGEANSDGNNCPCDAFTWSPSTGMVDLGSSSATGAPDSGAETGSGAKATVVTDSGASSVNDLGQAAGRSTTGGETQAVLWSPPATTVKVTGHGRPILVHQSVTFTATVSSAAGRPAGTVSFYDGATLLGTSPLERRTATLTTASLSPGDHDITATYEGNASFLGGTSEGVTQVVTYEVRSSSGSSRAPAGVVDVRLLGARNVNLSSPGIAVDAECVAPSPATSCADPVVNLNGAPLPYLSASDEYGFAPPGGLAPRTGYDLIVAAQGDPVLHAIHFAA
jgi:hypothetical protein